MINIKSFASFLSVAMLLLIPWTTSAQQCDTLSNLFVDDTLAVYLPNQTTGYVSGHNGYGDDAKADIFTNYPANSQLNRVLMQFGVAKSSGPNATFDVKVWDNSGTGGNPGTVLASETVTYSSVVQDVNNNALTEVTFSNPPTISNDFYVGIEYSYAAGDTLALYTAEFRSNRDSTAWERWASGQWNPYTTFWGPTSHAILPIVCSSSSQIDAGIDSINRGEYTSYPQSQTAAIPLSGTIKNYGNQSVTNPTLQVDVFDVSTTPPSNIYSDNNSASSLTAGNSVNLSMPTNFTPPDTGGYVVRYISSIDENDANPSNDTTFASFVVDDSSYARDKVIIGGIDSLSGGYGFGVTGHELDVGQTFEVVNQDTLTSISFLYSGDTTAASGDTIRGNIYNFSQSSGPGSKVAETEPYEIPDDSARFITLSPQNGDLELSAGEYLFTINNAPVLAYADNIYTPGSIWENDPFNPTSWERVDTVQNGQFQFAFVLWPNFGPTSTGGGNCQNFSVSVSSQDEICGSANGSVTANVSGGATPYNFNWSNTSQTGSSISGLSAGTYSVTVTDDNQCTATATATINNNNVTLNVSTSTTSAGCSGSNGSVTATVSNGTPQYSYSWNNAQNGQTIDNLSAGTYSVTVTDANGCTGTASATVSSGSGLSQVASFPLDYDSLDARAASNQPANQYQRLFFSLNENYTNTDNFTLDWGAQVYDSLYNYQTNTAYQKQNYTIRVDSILVPFNHTNTTGTNDTVIFSVWLNSTLSITGTSPNDQLTGDVYWSDTLIVSQSLTPQDSLGALSLNIDTVLPSKGEAFSFRVDFQGDTSNTFQVVAGYATSCADSCGGRPSVIESRLGNNSQYYLNLTSQGINFSGINNFPGYPGPPTCPSSCSNFNLQNFFFRPSISLLSSSSLSASVSTTDETCGGGNGTATVTVTSGNAPFNFDWNTGQTDSSISGLSAGTYTVTVTDADSCTVVDTATVTNNNLTLNVSTSTQSTSCGSSNGSATASVSNGTPQYSYSWSNNQSGATINNLAAGTYTVTVTDANGCTGTATATVNAPGAPTVNVTKTDITCNGANDGTATVSATGGSGNYTINWSNNSSGNSISGLSPGSYTVTVTDDSTNCDATSSVTINEPSPLTVTLDTTSVTCNGGTDGSVTANPSGGTTPYSYSWSTGDQGAVLGNVSAGSYIVTVSDDNNCTITDTATVDEPSGFSVTTTSTDADCNQSNGTAEVSSPTGNYSYNWSNGQTGQSITVSAGSYTVTVTNNNTNCDKTATVSVSNVGGPTISVDNTTDVSCNGGSDGSATVSGSGGNGSLTYTWDDGSSGTQNTGLSQGTYSVTVEDQNSCIDVTSVTINEPQALSISFITTDASCPGSSDGNAAANVTGGTPSYTYNWVNASSSSATASNLAAGNYILSVSDANNCDVIDTVSVDEPNPLAANMSTQDVSCNGASDGEASVDNVTGGTPFSGTPSYSYNWSTSASSSSIDNQSAGSYDVTITDANGCSIVESVSINEPQPLNATAMVDTDVSCNGDADGAVTAMGSGGTTPYEYSINANQFVTNNTFTNLSGGAKTITIRDDNGCKDDTTVTVNEPSPLTASIEQEGDVTCKGADDGFVQVNASGGTPTYQYSTDGANFQSNDSIGGLGAGQFTVFVQDDNNCQTTVNTTINEPAPLSVDTNSVTDASSGNNNGSIDLSVSGGTTPYNYNWSNDASSQDISDLSPGDYTVTVTDDNGCSETLTVTVDQEVGVAETSLDQYVSIYPNPTSAKVTIELEMNKRQDVTISIYNLLGESMIKEKLEDRSSYQKSMDFGDEASGVYYVKLSTGESTITRKIIVNR